ncbi:hypothetical protein ACGTN9_10735 [Halobacillus sp. MO56]
MEAKPMYFDGSMLNKEWGKKGAPVRKEMFQFTDEMRKKISASPCRVVKK